jgi:hypothetical protein
MALLLQLKRVVGLLHPFRLVLLFCLISSGADALPLSEIQIFYKCYGMMTNSSPAPGHHALLMVQQGTWTGVQGCMWVFDRATLIQSGVNFGKTTGEISPQYSTDATDALSLLKTFNNFHKKWFSNTNLDDGIGFTFTRSPDDIFSASESAAHISRILFTPGANYRDLVTGTRSIWEMRDGAPTIAYPTDPNFGQVAGHITNVLSNGGYFHNFRSGFISPEVGYGPISAENFTPHLLEVGTLHGFRSLTETEMNQRVITAFTTDTTDNVGSQYSNLFENTAYRENLEVQYLRPYGGGILGTPSFLILNLGAEYRDAGYPRSDGGIRMWRRPGRSIHTDLMCRTLPTLTAADAVAFVRPASTVPFRTNTSCMQCHATIDNIAGAFRNFAIGSDHNFAGLDGVPNHAAIPMRAEFATLVSHPTIIIDPSTHLRRSLHDGAAVSYAPAEADIFGSDRDYIFFRRPPNGKFMTRDYAGHLISEDVQGVEQLGQAIATVDDYYICAASRYFKFFTNFEASLLDVPNASPGEIRARNYVISLGLQLKQSQNLRTTIQDIISSDFFKEGFE